MTASLSVSAALFADVGSLARSSLPPDEIQKYEEQYDHIQAILHIYEHHPDDYPRLFGALQQVRCRPLHTALAHALSASIRARNSLKNI